MRADQGVRLPDDVWALCKQSGLRRLLVGVESGSDEMLKRIRKDITIEQVFHTAQKMRELRHRRHLPVHRRVSRTRATRASTRRSLCAKRLRAMSAGLRDADLLFQALPGQRDRHRSGGARLSAARLRSRTGPQFDYVDGVPGPWVSREKFQLIERFKFFLELAWERRPSRAASLQRARAVPLQRDDYRWPIEMRRHAVAAGPEPRLS